MAKFVFPPEIPVVSSLPPPSSWIHKLVIYNNSLYYSDGTSWYDLRIASDSDKVDGFHANQTPTANTIPVAGANGKIGNGWLQASQTPTANTIPVADANGKIGNGWLQASYTPTANTIPVAGSGGKLDNGWLRASYTPAANTIPVSNSSGKIVDGWLNFVANDPKVKTALNASGDAPIYACRAWVNFNGTTNPPTIRASGNVSSVVKNGTGDYTVNFITNMSDSNYSVVITSGAGTVNPGDARISCITSISSTSCRYITFPDASLNKYDSLYSCVSIFR